VDAVIRRIVLHAQDLAGAEQSRCTALLWQEFLGGWCPTTWSSAYCEDFLAQWQRLKQGGVVLSGYTTGGNVSLPPSQSSGANGSGSSSSSSSAAGSSTVAGGAGAGTSTTPARQLPQSGFEFQVTIPCSVDIVGKTLGTKFTGTCQCSGCKGSRTLAGITLRRSARRYDRRKGSRCQVSTQLTARGTGERGPRVVRNPSELQFKPGSISSTIYLIGTVVCQFQRVSKEAFLSLTLRSVSRRHPPNYDAQ
jgi:hypothetical protein